MEQEEHLSFLPNEFMYQCYASILIKLWPPNALTCSFFPIVLQPLPPIYHKIQISILSHDGLLTPQSHISHSHSPRYALGGEGTQIPGTCPVGCGSGVILHKLPCSWLTIPHNLVYGQGKGLNLVVCFPGVRIVGTYCDR